MDCAQNGFVSVLGNTLTLPDIQPTKGEPMNTMIVNTANATRAIHLLDIENLMGTPYFTAEEVRHFKQLYMTSDFYEDGDQIVIATSNARGLVDAGAGWGDARYTFQHGADGADLALIEILHSEHIADRFGRVVIASGDGIFADEVRALVAAHVDVHVVARATGIHHCLREVDACLHLLLSSDFALAA
ncbi:MAG: hypothetical protein RLZZ40_465 [Actinomycetota bacterium]|jgi:uncharacterized LabA/DUF88 family protein